MRIPADALIAVLTDPRFHLAGDDKGGVGLRCRDHQDGTREFAYYRDATPSAPTSLGVVHVATIPGLWAEAVKHLATEHHPEAGS
jgi:hypothetical protein